MYSSKVESRVRLDKYTFGRMLLKLSEEDLHTTWRLYELCWQGETEATETSCDSMRCVGHPKGSRARARVIVRKRCYASSAEPENFSKEREGKERYDILSVVNIYSHVLILDFALCMLVSSGYPCIF